MTVLRGQYAKIFLEDTIVHARQDMREMGKREMGKIQEQDAVKN
jgi:hypothetical protein